MKKYIQITYLLVFILISILVLQNYDKIPTREQHISRNKNNILPFGKLTLISNDGDDYLDENNIIWEKRKFKHNILHDPFKNYTFETYNPHDISSSEATISISDYEKGVMNFKSESFNYYSSYYYPVSHFFADVLPILLYLGPEYTKY